MKKLLLLALVLSMGSGVAFADDIRGAKRMTPTCVTSSGVVLGGSHQISGFLHASTGSAGAVGFYDATGTQGATAANLKFETPAAANDGKYVDTSDAPIDFANGVVAVLSNSNVGCVYERTTP